MTPATDNLTDATEENENGQAWRLSDLFDGVGSNKNRLVHIMRRYSRQGCLTSLHNLGMGGGTDQRSSSLSAGSAWRLKHRLPEKTAQHLVSDFRAGSSMASLAKHYAISDYSVRLMLATYGATQLSERDQSLAIRVARAVKCGESLASIARNERVSAAKIKLVLAHTRGGVVR